MQTKNDYTNDIINGDIGRVVKVGGGQIVVDFFSPARRVELPISENDLVLAYACTVHKYQGSEVPVVIIPFHKTFGNFMLTRNLLYTAISRASKLCIVVGQMSEVVRAIARVPQERKTMLKERIIERSSFEVEQGAEGVAGKRDENYR